MRKKGRCYVDTSAFIAFLDRSDSHHPLYRRLFGSPPPLITSALVIAEGHGWFLRRYGQRRSSEFLAFIKILPDLAICAFDADELEKASGIAKRFSDQDLTLADAHGLAIMREKRPECCWSTDRHLTLDGVPLAS